jgi:hypothetical protein
MEFIDNELQFRLEQLRNSICRLRLSFTMNDLFYWSTIRQERDWIILIRVHSI